MLAANWWLTHLHKGCDPITTLTTQPTLLITFSHHSTPDKNFFASAKLENQSVFLHSLAVLVWVWRFQTIHDPESKRIMHQFL
jgi:hypothetical protein